MCGRGFSSTQLVYIHWNPHIHQHSAPLHSSSKWQCVDLTDKENTAWSEHECQKKGVLAVAQPIQPASLNGLIPRARKNNEFRREKRRRLGWVTAKVSAPRDAFVLYCFTTLRCWNEIIQGFLMQITGRKELFQRAARFQICFCSFIKIQGPGEKKKIKKERRKNKTQHTHTHIIGQPFLVAVGAWVPLIHFRWFWLWLEQICHIWQVGRPRPQTCCSDRIWCKCPWWQRQEHLCSFLSTGDQNSANVTSTIIKTPTPC